ncbi:hypothetical protein FD27_GL000323 [Limosilactobacillus frumenti DSM 13145]|uniref:DUF4811 domain-containing protein n=1 Tax=Limosilactobacillus frumenti DSM 13145 TaxID=1423746 RepID=A0A0R1P667_9LACO|nr:DUF4811 domain-containing protein [Limosilactobacillus frumenti]KRL28049.1 hypothetical protein FD27_GL000323 [Limosilactobacillus frumenti DSM 13145]MBA2913458.1 DUF4811 domain-containing protein [Limosilactobacillus frumenti]QFG73124.1 DUF4811 domain-containing protein [Limosilactobacillus frumenti]
MIIILMFISAMALFACVMFINHRPSRIVGTVIFGLLFVGSTTLMTLNYSHHFGMHTVTTTTTKTVYSAGGKLPLAIYQPIGNSGKDNVFIYKTSLKHSKTHHTQANEYTTSKMKFSNRQEPQLTTTETRWYFKNKFYKALYMWSGMDGTLIERTNVINYPQSYIKVTTGQAKQLQTKAGKAGDAMQHQAQVFVTNKVQAAMAKDPQMSAQQIQQVSRQAEQAFMSQMIKSQLK